MFYLLTYIFKCCWVTGEGDSTLQYTDVKTFFYVLSHSMLLTFLKLKKITTFFIIEKLEKNGIHIL